ncbi:MAG: iron ABC transporter permease, partial [Pseudohongiellaceae bacterium]
MPARKFSFPGWLLLLAISLPLLVLLHLNTGPATVSILSAIADLINDRASIDSIIFLEVRLPRALLAATIGASLALSGAALQGMLHNPLASPGLLGITQTAALAAVLTLYFGLANAAWFILPVAAMGGALLAVMIILLLAGRYSSILSIILIGIAINAMSGSFTSLALNYAPDAYAMQEIFFWMLGSVANRSMNELFFALPFMLLGWALIFSQARFLTAMTLGEASARSLGFNINLSRWLIIVGVASCTGASVAVSGNISFIGLVVPHLMRPLVGHDPGRLLWASGIGGACLLLLSDIAVQLLSTGQELQLGVITAAIGGPFFLYLIL